MRFQNCPPTLQRTFRKAFLPIAEKQQPKKSFIFPIARICLLTGPDASNRMIFNAVQILIGQEKNTAKADYDSGAVHQSDFVRRLAGSLDEAGFRENCEGYVCGKQGLLEPLFA